MARVNAVPQLYITVLRGGMEYGHTAATPWQPGESETLIVRARNVNAARLDAVGSITINANGHSLEAAVEIGQGTLDAEGRFIGPTQLTSSPMAAAVAGADLLYNVRIPWGCYVELRVQVVWGNVDTPVTVVYGPEVPVAPTYRYSGTPAPAAGIPAIGTLPPVPPTP